MGLWWLQRQVVKFFFGWVRVHHGMGAAFLTATTLALINRVAAKL